MVGDFEAGRMLNLRLRRLDSTSPAPAMEKLALLLDATDSLVETLVGVRASLGVETSSDEAWSITFELSGVRAEG